MRWQERQDKIEAAVYEAINELADELGVDVPDYPLVVWAGRTVSFNDLCVPVRYLSMVDDIRIIFEYCRCQKISFYYHELRTVFIFNDNLIDIKEESAHALHLLLTNPSLNKRGRQDKTCFDVLIEVNGFLGARLIGSTFSNPYQEFPDMSRLTDKGIADLKEVYGQDGLSEDDFVDDFIHQQGYGLGENIYQAYLKGRISLAFIRRLFLDRWPGKNSAIKKFKRLKKRFWLQP